MVKKVWQYVKPFSSDTGTLRMDGRTDGRTDRQIYRRTDLLYQYRASVCWRAIKMVLIFTDSVAMCCLLISNFNLYSIIITTRAVIAQQNLSVLSVYWWVCLFDCQRDNSRTVWDMTTKFLPEQDIFKSSDEFENVYIPMHCGARWRFNISDVLVVLYKPGARFTKNLKIYLKIILSPVIRLS